VDVVLSTNWSVESSLRYDVGRGNFEMASAVRSLRSNPPDVATAMPQRSTYVALGALACYVLLTSF
jgi:hypothetical protein